MALHRTSMFLGNLYVKITAILWRRVHVSIFILKYSLYAYVHAHTNMFSLLSLRILNRIEQEQFIDIVSHGKEMWTIAWRVMRNYRINVILALLFLPLSSQFLVSLGPSVPAFVIVLPPHPLRSSGKTLQPKMYCTQSILLVWCQGNRRWAPEAVTCWECYLEWLPAVQWESNCAFICAMKPEYLADKSSLILPWRTLGVPVTQGSCG